MTTSYAIDFGTSNTLISLIHNGTIKPIEIKGDRLIKSIFYFASEEEVYFGIDAIEEYTKNSFEGRLIRSIKKFLPDEKFAGTQIDQRIYNIESFIGAFLRFLKAHADKESGLDVCNLVLARPAQFSSDKKQDSLAQDRLYRAAKIAGFKNIHFIAEPLAASHDFPKDKKIKYLFVIDLGAGTSDFSCLELLPKSYKVLSLNAVSVAGDHFDGDLMQKKISPHLGSEVDYKLPLSSNILQMPASLKYQLRSPADICMLSRSDIQDFLNDIKKSALQPSDKEKIESLQILIEDNLAYNIYQAIEKWKIDTCTEGSANFSYDYPKIQIKESLILDDFKSISSSSREKIIQKMQDCLTDSGIKPESIDLVLITGGSSKIPFLQKDFESIFSREKLYYSSSFESVVNGLAKEALRIFP